MPCASGKAAIGGAQGDSLSIHNAKQQRAAFTDLYLRVKSRAFKVCRSRDKFPGQALVLFYRAGHRWHRQAMQLRRHGVQKDQSPAGKDARHELRERRSKCFLATIALAKPPRSLFSKGAFEHPGGSRFNFLDAFAQRDLANAAIRDSAWIQIEAFERASLRKKTMIHFGKIMILGREPKNWNGVRSLCRQLARDMNRRQGLINAVSRPSKQSNLLPRDYGYGAVTKPVQIAERIGIAAEGFVLRNKHIHNGAPDAVVVTNVPRGVQNPIQIRGMRVKFGNAGKISKKSDIQGSGVRHLGRWDKGTLHGALHNTIGMQVRQCLRADKYLMNQTPSRFTDRRPKGHTLFPPASYGPTHARQISKRHFRIALAMALAFTGVADGAPQNPPPQAPAQAASPQASQPALHAVTRLVQVNVIVQNKKGEPVTDLTKDDFEIFDQGKPQTISVFSMESARILEGPGTPLAPNVYTNRIDMQNGVPASITVILIDSLNTHFTDMTYARQQLTKYLKQIQPQDRVAVYGLTDRLKVIHEFTNDATSLIAALNRTISPDTPQISASDPDPSNTGDDDLDAFLDYANQQMSDSMTVDRAETTAKAIQSIANHIAKLPGRQKKPHLAFRRIPARLRIG